MPLVIAGPHIPAQRIPEPVSLADVAHTVANLLDLPPTAGGGGVSLVGRLTGEPADAERLIFVDRIHHDDRAKARQLAVIHGRWKLIYRAGNGAAKLFDLDTDPHEKRPLTEADSPHFARLKSAARDRLARYRTAMRRHLIERRVSRRRPMGIQGAGRKIAPGIALLGGTIERVDGPRPIYEGRIWLEAKGEKRPDYRLHFTWANRKKKKVARRTIRPLGGLYRTRDWRKGDIVEVVVRADIKRARPPLSLRLALSAKGQPETKPIEVAYMDEAQAPAP